MIGQMLGQYRLVEKIGEGGMGVVYRAEDTRLGRDVAVKVLPTGTLSDDAARRRFRQEALTLAKLNHPNIETLYNFDSLDGVDYLAMEFIPGHTLANRLQGEGLPEAEVISLGAQLAAALEEAHEHGVVHRDIKPGNLIVTPRGQVKILDFGLARLAPTSTTTTTTTHVGEAEVTGGTLPYMSPEQLRGEKSDARADLYSFGVVLYEMATGKRPFPDEQPAQLITAILNREPPLPRTANATISEGLQNVILKCLSKNRENRYSTAREVAEDLQKLALPMGVAVPAIPARGWTTRRQWIVGAVALAMVLLVIFLKVGRGTGGGTAGTPAADVRSLAVLPLANLSGNADQEYFSEGMTEALTTELGRIQALRVVSLRTYKGNEKLPSEIGKDAKVDAVVRGSVLRDGDRVRISVQLADTATNQNLWAESFDRPLQDVLALHSEVARSVAQQIRATLTAGDTERLEHARTARPDAYVDYLKGRYHWNRRTTQDTAKAIHYFEQAIQKDPKYAPSYVGLADCYLVLWGLAELPAAEASRKATEAARRALDIDESLGEAHASLASIYFFDYNWAEAEKEFQRAIELSPSHPTAHHWYALYLSASGQHDKAIVHIRKAAELEPLSLVINANIGWCLYLAGRFDESIENSRRVMEMEPAFGHGYIAQAYLAKGMHREAIAEFERALESSRDSSGYMAELANAYAVAGQTGRAHQILAQLKLKSRTEPVSAYNFATIYAGLGDKDQTFAWLEKSAANREGRLVNLKVHPRFQSLRSDPRFGQLLKNIGLVK